MKTYLIFDTETTGVPKNYKAPASDLDNWPRVVQLAWLLAYETGAKLEEFECIVKPDGFVIPESASAIHGITTERAANEGIDLWEALKEIGRLVTSQTPPVLVAHNLAFDEKILAAEWLRLDLAPVSEAFLTVERRCTMVETVAFCNLPGNYGKPKWPKLDELHAKLFGVGVEDAHDALNDVRATARCLFELQNQGVIRL